jgi:ClpP class serine protease
MEGIVNKIREIPKKHGIRTFAFTDGYAASAAYGIASATQTIYAMPTSRLGSIAAIRTLIDMTKADAEEGLKYVLLRSKEDKALYNPHEEISPKVLEKAKSDLALLDSAFNSLVMKNRGNLSLEAIIGFQGNTYFGSEAVQLGLADALVETFDEVMAIERRLINRGMNVMTEEEIQALQAQNASLLAQVAASSTEAKALFSAERERISKLTLAAETLKIPKDRLVKAIDSGISYEDGLSAFETFAEISGSKNAINTMGGNSSLDIPPVEDTSASSSPFAALARGMDKAIELGLLRGGN